MQQASTTETSTGARNSGNGKATKRDKRAEVDCLLGVEEKEPPQKAERPLSDASPVVDVPNVSEPRPLWGEQLEPQVTLKKERLRHRLISQMLAEGYDNKEVAEILGISPVTVCYVAKQPFAVEAALQAIHSGSDAVMKKLHEAADLAADKLIGILETEGVAAEVLRKTANDVLDRKYGKPNQPYSTQAKPVEQMSDDELAKYLTN